MGWFEDQIENKRKAKLALRALCEKICTSNPNIKELVFPYAGYGDSGDIEPPIDPQGISKDILDEMQGIIYDILPDFYNDEGGQGDFSIKIDEDMNIIVNTGFSYNETKSVDDSEEFIL